MSQDRDILAITPRHRIPNVDDMTNTNQSPRPRWSALAGIALIGATALSGCTLRFTEPGTPPPSSPSDEAPSASDPSLAGDPPADDAPRDRDAYIARADQTVPCSPGLDIGTHGGIIRVEGDCETLTVSADAAVVVADNVGTLTVTGSASTVFVLDVSSLHLSWDANLITWTGTTPMVADDGTSNTIGKDLR